MHVGIVCRSDVDSGLDLANAISEAGASVSLYLSHPHTIISVDDPVKPVDRLYELGILPRECQVHLRDIPRMRDPQSFHMIQKLAQRIRNDKIDVVHILMGPGEIWLAVLASILRNIPVISTMVIPKPNVGEGLPDWIVIVAHKLLAFGSELIIVNGADQVSLVHDLYRVSPSKLVYIPLYPRTTASKWSIRNKIEEATTILFFGAARPHKGLEYIIKAQPLINQHIPTSRLLIVSRGDELERCKQMIQDNNMIEIIEGFVTGDVMADVFQRASIVVMPYLSASTSGNLLTAYSFKKPVVATNVGCLPEYVEDGVTGLLVEPANIEQLASAIVQLLSDKELREKMGENAGEWIRRRQNEVINQLMATYQNTISTKSIK